MFLNRPNLKSGGISTRLTMVYSLVLILSSATLFILLYMQISRVFERQEFAILDSQISVFESLLAEKSPAELQSHFADFEISNSHRNMFVMVVSPRGELFFLHEATPSIGIEADLLNLRIRERNGFDTQFTIPESYGSNNVLVITRSLKDGNKLVLAKSSRDLAAQLIGLRNIFLWFLLLVLIFGLVGGLFLSRKTLGPIRELLAIMKKIESGSLSTRVPVGGSYGELEELKVLSNKMLNKIEHLINGLKEAFDHLAHDIRTPVTRLRGRAELALTQEGDVETYREALQSCYENSDKILNFLQILTDITEAENRSKKLKLEKKYISEIVKEIMSLYEMSFEEKDVAVIQHLDPNDWALVDARLISRVVANLLDNAIKYTPSGGQVKIETINHTENVILRVTDTGPGIALEEQGLIWQKLYRSDKSRSAYGMGLGLTFVKAVVEAHDGKVSVRSPVKDGKGTEFEVVLQKMS